MIETKMGLIFGVGLRVLRVVWQFWEDAIMRDKKKIIFEVLILFFGFSLRFARFVFRAVLSGPFLLEQRLKANTTWSEARRELSDGQTLTRQKCWRLLFRACPSFLRLSSIDPSNDTTTNHQQQPSQRQPTTTRNNISLLIYSPLNNKQYDATTTTTRTTAGVDGNSHSHPPKHTGMAHARIEW
jgi:hypothetical protein